MPSVHVGQGLTGVVLCGPGASLAPLTSPTTLPKPLLPIANKPMIQYALEWLQEGGITTAIIVCMHEHEAALASYIKTVTEKAAATSSSKQAHAASKPVLRFKPTIVATKHTSTPLSTAAVLRLPQVRSQIKSDFILLPCDLICEIPVGVLVNHWMAQQTSYCEQKGPLGVYYETGQDKGLERDVVVTSPIPSHSVSKANPNFAANVSKLSTLLVPLGQKPESVKLRTSLIEAHPRLSIHSTLRSAHVFLFPLWVLNFIAANPYKRLHSVKDDVVELLAKASWQGRGEYAKKLGLFDILAEQGRFAAGDDLDGYEDAHGDVLKVFNLDAEREDLTTFSTMRQSSTSALTRQATRDVSTRGWASDGIAMAEPLPTAPIEDEEREDYFKLSFKPKEPMYSGFYIPPFTIFTPDMEIEPLSTKPLVRRVDTLPLFLSTSLEVARNSPPSQPIALSADIHQRCTVTPNDCIIGDNCTGDEKSLIKRSVLGQKVTVSKLARVNGCVLLDGVTVGEGSKLEGCVVGRNARIGKGCTLVGCEIGEGAIVDDDVDAKNETFEFEEEDDDDSTFDDNALESESESSEEDEMPLSPRASKLAASTQLGKKQEVQKEKQGEEEEEEDEVDSDYDPSSGSSYCEEEFDSEYESDGADDDDDDAAVTSAAEATATEQPEQQADEEPSGADNVIISGTQETEAV